MTGGLGSATSQDRGFFSSSFTAFSPRIQYAPFRQKDAKHPLPLPLGEVDERSEDGEGKPGCNALSVAYGDSSPGGRAKGVYHGTKNGAHLPCLSLWERWPSAARTERENKGEKSVTFGDSSPGGRAKAGFFLDYLSELPVLCVL